MSAIACGGPDSASLPAVLEDMALDLAGAVPPEFAHVHRVLPWRFEAGELVLLAAEAPEFELSERANELGFALGRPVQLVGTNADALTAAIARHYGTSGAPRPGPESQAGTPTESKGCDPARPVGQGAEVVDLVADTLAAAVRRRASDIHFEPFDQDFTIRYRIDGVLHDVASPGPEIGAAVSSRIKVLAGLDIAERRVAQDGRIRLAIDGREIDFRVSTLPTLFGESVVLRVLDAAAIQLELPQLGLPPGVLAGIRDVIGRPHGIFIVTGPTGSGKTTTLYSCLRELNVTEVKVLTVEDPVEYELEGVMQVGVNPVAGLSFASALRSFLRQDPDVIMVGEIRDLETAQIAIQAALTGHLVLTTLHTNDAAGAVTRLLDMGVEPFLLAATLEGVLAQRLVRRRCLRCQLPDLAEPAAQCPECDGAGFRGRLGIYELLMVNEEIRELLARREPVERIRDAARKNGMRPLAVAADEVVRSGLTTRAEVLKHL